MSFLKRCIVLGIVGSMTLVACSDSVGTPADAPDGGDSTLYPEGGTGDSSVSVRPEGGPHLDDAGSDAGGPANECTDGTANCDSHATCTDLAVGFSCACKTGYAGDGKTCSDVDECAPGAVNNCDSHAQCTNTPGSFTCTCKTGYAGDGITCTDVNECAPGAVNNCAPVGATCMNTAGGFTCACTTGYAGDGVTCTDINECAPGGVNNCAAVGSTCTNTPGSFTCACNTGYAGDGIACTDINECAPGGANNCAAVGSTCTNTPGSFTCACNTGYAGNGITCTDTNECAPGGANNCAAVGATCTNTPGSFTCACNTGYAGNGITCTDVDECAPGAVNSCDPNATCTNTPGAYTCKCTAGYVGSGKACAPKSFDNPVQIDVSALLTVDTVLNNGAPGGLDPLQDSIDGTGYKMVTQSAADQIRPGKLNYGLPDNAIFAKDANHPALHLTWDNADNGFNSRIVKTNDTFTIPVPATTYTGFQVYTVSSEGPSSMQFTLNYSDGTTDVRNVTFADWFNNAGAGTFYVIDGLDRVGAGNVYDPVHNPDLVGANLTPNAAKTLISVVAKHLTSAGWFVFFGAAAW